MISLFTNILLELTRESIAKKWKYFKGVMSISKKEFLNVLDFVLDSTYFIFNGKFSNKNLVLLRIHLYLLIIALVMEDLEMKAS